MRITVDGVEVNDIAPGTTIGEFLLSHEPGQAEAALAARLNGRLVDLTSPLEEGRLEVINWEDEEGKEVYRHTASHIMAQAVMELFPGTRLAVGPAISEGFYYDFDLAKSLSPEDLGTIEERMGEIIERNLPLVRETWAKEEALSSFKDQGQGYKAELLVEIDEDEEIGRAHV